MSFTTFQGLLNAVVTGTGNLPAAVTIPSLGIPTPKRKFMLVATHGQQTTGYSKVSYNIIQELSKYEDIEVFHFGFQRFFDIGDNYRPYPVNVQIYDPAKAEKENEKVSRENGFGFSQLPTYIRAVKPDIVMIYNDAGIICNFLEKLESNLSTEERAAYKLIIYLDQVYTVQRPDLMARMDKAATAFFAFTDYWREQMIRQGIQKPIHILRHGFDGDLFKPLPRAELRRKHGIPENVFMILNLNRNTPRKHYDIVAMAFAQLVARYPTKPLLLLCVCDGGEQGGFPIQEIYARELARLGIPLEYHINKLALTKTALNYADETVAELYNMSDIGVNAAEGEGFGLCNFEAMGCGVPQVVPDVGGFKDFCRSDNAVLVSPAYCGYLPFAYSQIGGFVELLSPSDLCLGIEEYMLDSEKRVEHGKRARETVLTYRWSEEVAKLTAVIRTL